MKLGLRRDRKLKGYKGTFTSKASVVSQTLTTKRLNRSKV